MKDLDIKLPNSPNPKAFKTKWTLRHQPVKKNPLEWAIIDSFNDQIIGRFKFPGPAEALVKAWNDE